MKKSLRRVNDDNKQLLLTSLFSLKPRTASMINDSAKARDEDRSVELKADEGDNPSQ